MRKTLLCCLLAFCAVMGIFCPTAQAAPSVSAKAAVLIDADTGEILFQKNAHEKRAMASTTKIMTALLSLESEKRSEPFTVDNAAIRVEGTSMGLLEGDIVTLNALAAGMLMLSGNDAANAASVFLAGSKEAFAEMMNARAAQIGMKNTSFVTPSGLDDEMHYSTAYDMALLGAEAIKNADFVEISSKSRYTVSYGEPAQTRTYSNHNRLVREIEGCIGIKTGFTKKAGRCLVSAVEKNGRTLVCVTLSAPNDWQDHKSLYNFGFSLYEQTPAPKITPPALSIVNAAESEIPLTLSKQPDTVFIREGEKIEVKTSLRPFEYAPVFKGDVVGKVTLCSGNAVLFETELVANASAHHLWEKHAEEKKNPFEKLMDWLFGLFHKN